MTSPEAVLDRPASRAGHDRHAIGIVAMFLLSRLALVAVGLATKLSQGERLQFPADLVDLFVRWDASWYLAIVEHGYSNEDSAAQPGATTYAFCPIFPLLVRLVARITDLPAVWAALVVSNCAFLAALFAVFAYGRRIGLGDRAAVYATALLTVTPGSFLFSAPYSESVFLLLLATAMLSTISGRFWSAGLAAAVLSAVRLNGFLFAAFPAAKVIRQAIRAPSEIFARPEALLPIALAPAGMLAFFWFSYVTTGDAFGPMTSDGRSSRSQSRDASMSCTEDGTPVPIRNLRWGFCRGHGGRRNRRQHPRRRLVPHGRVAAALCSGADRDQHRSRRRRDRAALRALMPRRWFQLRSSGPLLRSVGVSFWPS
jgi:Mannosyltransferase (PIG-V)